MKNKSQNNKPSINFLRSIFDLNKDGKNNISETALSFMIFQKIQQEKEEKQNKSSKDKVTDLDDLNIDEI